MYVVEAGGTFGTRLEHKKEVENITTRRFTREQKRESAVVEHKSAITDQADRNNYIIDWEGAKVKINLDKSPSRGAVRYIKYNMLFSMINRENNRNARWIIKEDIWIMPCMGRPACQANWQAKEKSIFS